MSSHTDTALLNVVEAIQWGNRASLSGARLLEAATNYLHASTFMGENSKEVLNSEENIQVRLTFDADNYFFVMSFANYLKAIRLLRREIKVDRFENLGNRPNALRNIREHWEDHRWVNLISGRLSAKSKRNFDSFKKHNPEFPALPFSLTVSKLGEITIADTLNVRELLNIIEKNKSIIESHSYADLISKTNK